MGAYHEQRRRAQITAELDAINALGFDGAVFLVDDNFIGNRAGHWKC